MGNETEDFFSFIFVIKFRKYSASVSVPCRKGQTPQRIEYSYEAHDSLLFGSYETSPIIRLGKPTPAISYEKRDDR